jgi:hypothetical protein
VLQADLPVMFKAQIDMLLDHFFRCGATSALFPERGVTVEDQIMRQFEILKALIFEKVSILPTFHYARCGAG